MSEEVNFTEKLLEQQTIFKLDSPGDRGTYDPKLQTRRKRISLETQQRIIFLNYLKI